MLTIQIQLYRPFDRDPGDHIYGEPFDSVADSLIGGAQKWSSPRDLQGNPQAVIPGTQTSIELHEDGPVLEFILQNVDQIPNYISAIAGVVSAWIAARALRKQSLPANDYRNNGGTVISVGDLRIESQRNLEPDEIQRLLTAIATTSSDREKSAANVA